MNLDALKNLNFRDPRVLMRVILGVLLLGNLVAFYFVIYPLGGAPHEHEAQLQALVSGAAAQRKTLDRLRLVTKKVEGAGRQAGDFEMANFTDRRVVYSTLVNEITQAAESAGIKLKDHALQNEEIEGSDTLGMITVNANYEGTYGDLLNFVNRIDRSQKFVIIDSLAATPQQGSNQLNVTMKMNLFVRNTADLVLPKLPGKPGKESALPGLPELAPSASDPGEGKPASGPPKTAMPPSSKVAEPPSTTPQSMAPQSAAPQSTAPLAGSRTLGTPPSSSPLQGPKTLGTPPTSSPLAGPRSLGTPPTSSPLPGAPLRGAKL